MKIKISFLISILVIVLTPLNALCLDKSEEAFYVATKAFSDGFYDASLSLFKKFIEDYPGNYLFYDAKLYIAKCHYEKSDYHQALKELTSVNWNSGSYNKLDEVYYWLGLVYFKGKNFSESSFYAQEVINNYPDSKFRWQAYYLMGDSLLALSKEDEAEDIFEKIIEQCRDSEVLEQSYLRLINFHFNKKLYSKVINFGEKYLINFRQGSLRPEIYFYLAEGYHAQGNWGEAIDFYKKSLESGYNADFLDLIYQGLGFAYLEKKQYQEAKSSIDKIKSKESRLFSQGIYYSKTKDYIQALEIFNNFISNYPGQEYVSEVYLKKADLLYEMGRLNDALYIYQYIITNFKDIKDKEVINKAHYGLAWCHLKNGKFKNAIEEFKSTLEYASNPVVKVSSQIQIADAYQETGDYQKALDIYNEVLKDYPNTIYLDYIQFQIGMSYMKKKELDKAFLALKNLKNNFPSSRLIPQAQYYLAVGYFSQEDYPQTRKLLEDFVERFPKDDLIFRVYYLYGKCFFNDGEYEEALSVFKKIFSKSSDPDIKEFVYIDMGNTYLNLSQFEKAKNIWYDFLNKYPDSQYRNSVALYLGGLYEKENNYNEAEKYYKKVIDDSVSNAYVDEAIFSLGHLYWNRNNLDIALDYFKKLSTRNTPFALKGKLFLAKILSRQEKYDEALQIYNQLIDSSMPISGMALAEKGFLLKETKKYKQAIGYFREAISKEISTPELRFSLGLCLEKVGADQEAIEEYFKIIYTFADEQKEQDSEGFGVRSYFRIAKIYEGLNKIDEAKKTYQKIIDLDIKEAKIAKTRLEALENMGK